MMPTIAHAETAASSVTSGAAVGKPTWWVTGTPSGRWGGLAAATGVGGMEDPHHPDLIKNWTDGAWRQPSLVFVDGPAHAVAQQLMRDPEMDPAQCLSAWCRVAQRILHQAHAPGSKSLLVDTEEALRHPLELQILIARRFSASVAVVVADLPATDPLVLSIGAAAVREMRQAQALYAELQATCEPLAEAGEQLGAEQIDVGAAAKRLRDLNQSAAALERELGLANRQWAAAQVVASTTQGHVDTACSLAEAQMLLLHETQEQLQDLYLQHRHTVGFGGEIRRVAPVSRLAIAAEGARAAALSRAAAAAPDAGFADDEPLLVSGDQRSELEAAHLQSELLLIQLHTVQEELEQHFLALKAHDADSGTAMRTATAGFLVVGALVLGEVSSASPHHHLAFDLQHVQTPFRTLARLRLRLVEHHGRPGLVFMAGEPSQEPLGAWQATGSEDGQAYMALLPADPDSQERLQRLATGDWRFILELVALLHAKLAVSKHPGAARWCLVAARLQRQLSQLPSRLRYSRLQVRSMGDAASQPGLEVRICDVMFGLEVRGDLQLSWHVPSPAGEASAKPPLLLQYIDSGSAVPPLSNWPVDAGGNYAATVVLPVGSGLPSDEKRRLWGSLTLADQDLVLALLDALPACAGPHADRQLPAPVSLPMLADAARALHRDARRTLSQMQLRRVVRKVLRRGRES